MISAQSQPRNAAAGQRMVSIDALRGLAALAVTLFHALRFRSYVGTPGIVGESIAFVLSWGLTGVYLFFVISGFCIHLNWAKRRSMGELHPRIDFIAFWKRRFRRLYPAYLVSMALYILGQAWSGEWHVSSFAVFDVVIHLLMLHNFLAATTFSLNGVFWTLAVEEQLYLAYFLLLRLRKRFGWGAILAFTLFARLAWFAIGFALHRTFHIEFTVTEAAASVWFCWVLGALSVEALYGLVVLPSFMRNGWVATLTLLASLVIGFVDRVGAPTGLMHHLRTLILQPMWGLGFFFVVNVVVRREAAWASRGGWPRMFAKLGLFSYSLYLTHELVLTQLVGAMARRWALSDDARTLWSLLVFVPICVGLSRVFFVAFERPFMTKVSHASEGS